MIYALYAKRGDKWQLRGSSNDWQVAQTLMLHWTKDGTFLLMRKYWFEFRVKKVIRM